MTDNLYAVLGVSSDASEEDVRKAYVRKIREYPPEQHAEEFKTIRHAYETLSNAKSRKEYDTMAIHGEELNELLSSGLVLIDEEDYEAAATKFKKILMIEPSLNYVRNYYALALLYTGAEDVEKAIVQFRKLTAEEPDNATYFLNLGLAFKSLDRDDEALAVLRKGYLIDPDNVDLLFAIVDIHTGMKQQQTAKEMIESALTKLENTDFRCFVYLFKLLQVDIVAKNYGGLKRSFSRLEQLLLYNPDEKPFVAVRYAELALKMVGYKEFETAYFLCDKARELDADNDLIKDLYLDVIRRKPVYDEYRLMDEDEAVSPYVKRIVALYLFGDEVSEEEFDQYNEEAFVDLFKATKYLSDEILKSVRRILVHYPVIYEERKELFQKMVDSGKRYEAINKQYEEMKKDSEITNATIRLVSLCLADDLSESERKEYMDDILLEIDHESTYNVTSSLNRLKQAYPSLFAVNPGLFEEFLRVTRQSQSTPAPRAPQSSSSANNTSCFVATAAYGTALTEELDVLRSWRDQVLRRSRPGRRFISLYYRYGPYFAGIVEKSELLKRGVRRIVYLILKYLDREYELRGLN